MKTRRLTMMKQHTYGTRALVAGDEIEAPEMDAILMVLGKKARFAPRVRTSPPAKPEPPPWVEEKPEPEPKAETKPEQPHIESLRAEAERLGIEVDGRWGALRLEHEIGAAKRR